METTNNLKTKIEAKDKAGNTVLIDIRLNDECNNGHEDFAITGAVYEAGKPRTDRNCLGMGCVHDSIEEARPDLKPFILLHLSDANGVPMYAVENGFYHLQNGFDKLPPESAEFEAKYCEYYRISPAQFSALRLSHNSVQFALNLENLGILNQWKEEADAAIKMLEELTGKKFQSTATKSNYHRPTAEQMQLEEERTRTGYYTAEQIAKRAEQRRVDHVAKINADADKEIKKIELERDVKIRVFEIGGEIALDNCIFYNHTNQLKLNWLDYKKPVSAELIEKIKADVEKSFQSHGVKVE